MGDTGGQTVRVVDDNYHIDPVWNDFIDHSNIISQRSVNGTGPNTVITCSSETFFSSTFKTDAVQSSFEISQPINQSVDSLLLGLHEAQNNTISTNEILSAFDVDLSHLPPLVDAIVTVLKSSTDSVPSFRVDSSNGSKNGIWIIALNSKTLQVCSIFPILESGAGLQELIRSNRFRLP
jgi:hypothetical protein